jgi:exodeoxyribonuclease-3
MRIVTWNINSVRLRIDTLAKVVEALAPDVVCLQEIKVATEAFPHDDIAALGFDHRLVRGMKGYNGVAVLSKLPVSEGDSRDWCGREDARHLVAVLPGGAELHNFYVPSGGDVPDRAENDKFAHKLDFLAEMTEWSAGLGKAKRILVGDLNIAPLEADVWSHKQLLGVVSHTPVEVEALDGVMAAHGWIDAVRRIVPEDEQLYSWWSYRNRTWPGSDRGRRLDHIWLTPAMADGLKDAAVFRDARGWDKPSDHAPVWIDIDL